MILPLRNEGMGGFLNPPGHPEHNWSFSNRDTAICLSTAVTSEWLDTSCREMARTLLATWEREKLPLDSPEVQDWIRHVLGYFKGCYKHENPGHPDPYNVSNVRIFPKSTPKDELPPVDEHCGVHLIRGYYPDYVPTEQHFAEAY